MTGRRLRLLVAVGLVVVATTMLLGRSSRPSAADTTPTSILGEGGTFASPIINKLELDLDNADPSIDARFDDLPGVDVARQDFATGANDFAVSEFPLTSGEATIAKMNGRGFAYVPFAAQAVAVGFEMIVEPANTSRPQFLEPSIQLTAPTLADIMTDKLPTGEWDDPQIQQENPTLGLGTAVMPSPNYPSFYAPADPSAGTSTLIQLFLNDPVSRTIWDAYAVAQQESPDTAYEHFPGNNVQGGDLAMDEKFVTVDPATGLPEPAAGVQETSGVIGAIPMDWTIAPWDIPTVSIQNAAGDYVAPTPASMTAALDDAQLDSSTNLVSFPAQDPNPAAYVMPAMSYLVVPTSGLSPTKATALSALIRFALSPAGQRDVVSMDGVALTPAMEAAGEKVADEVAAEGNAVGATTATTAPKATAGSTVVPATTAPNAAPITSSVLADPPDSASTSPTTQFVPAPGAQPDGSETRAEANKGVTPLDAIALTSVGPLPIPLLVAGIVLVVLGALVQHKLRARSG